MTVVDRDGGAPGAPGTRGTRGDRAERPARRRGERHERGRGAVRTALTAWLSRPLADFHLILAICGLLTALGTIMVLSASSVASYDPRTGESVYAQFQKHVLFVAIGGIVFWLGLRIPLKRTRRLSATGMVVCLGLLALVLTPLGTSVNGSQGWFVLGPLSLQPVEVAKVALALWGAHILVTKYHLLHQWRHLLVPVVPAALLMFALVMAQPDLGGTITLGVVLMALLWFAGAPKRLFAVIFLGGVVGAVVLALVAQYRLARVTAFLNPAADPMGKGLQARQALYALADGGLFGKGLGQGQSKWAYLPNVQHDFIFALIGEELGFVGCAAVIGLFVLLAVVGLRIAVRNLDPWIRIVAGTLTAWLVAQAAINMGYVVNLLPVTGVTLPLISYGGTSLVVTMLLFGLLANCARHEPEAVAALRTQGPGKFGKLMRLPAPDPYRPPARRRGSGRGGSGRSGRPAARGARSAAVADRRRAAPEYGRRSSARGGTRGTSSRRGRR
ncbi:cell division protein FtsW [Amycolatopsis arida]|uniref:Probable peptidoglycan glycosyltransferase FtsW n=1 Tax=Amycolatopsis arida TaxID=587909 RepID=A0A1I5XJY2_9PSEU|nr:putative lipid II flippase FtsW [Amycolatopsis arida]TDX97397.1 cell division protein FtsW [Amycolatopsis arida]SFQ32303.1 cell division protein FtsW [Amycolatopsis arida]